jgi:DNA modification methylase
VLPPLRVHWHELPTDHSTAGAEKDGQGRLFRNSAIGVQEAAREKRESLEPRVAKVAELVRRLDGQAVIWCDLNDEQKAIEAALRLADRSFASLYGAQSIDEREILLEEWRSKRRSDFVSKPSMYGAGVNLQQSHTMLFAGIGFRFHEFIQAIHRIQRFGQREACDVHLIYTEAEREVRRELERKWKQHIELVERMTAIIQEYGLSGAAMAAELGRSIGCEREEARGERYALVRNDCVEETRTMQADSVGLIVTSIPFSHQYEYSPSYNDFGHTDDNAHFWRQMDFLTPELYRVLQPGRVCAVHVKDRVTPGGINGFGFQTVTRISDQCADHFERHGFAFLARKTIVTDVVRENNQTYRLGWSEQCKDGSRMGAGLPEYVLLFRKPPTDRSNGYADVPVLKSKDEYTRARWQYDAHGFTRSSGNRLLSPEDLDGLPQEAVFKLFRKYSLEHVYDFERDLAIAEHVDENGWLPSTFMLLPPQSWHPDVWTDVTRMRTLNADQSAKGKEMHLCPLQFDIVDRLILQFSMKDEEVFDPFAGLGTVAMRAVKLGRRGRGCELNRAYWLDSIVYCRAAELEMATPTLFDLDARQPEEEAA